MKTLYLQAFGKSLQNGIEQDKIDINGLVQIIELCNDYLNLKTISQYAKDHSLTYNGVKKTRKTIELFGNKYIIDND